MPASSSIRSALFRLAPAAALFVLVCGAFWKLTLTGQYTWANQSDMADQVLPWLQFQAREWQAGRWFPLWDPHHWGGQSLPGQLQPAVFYPFNWILFLWPLDPATGMISLRVLGWYLVLSRYLGSLLFYRLARDLGRSRTASVLGGALFASTGYLGTTEWPQVVNGVIWAPAVLMFGLRLLRATSAPVRWRAAAWMGASLAMSVLAGHYQVPSHLFLLAALLVGIAAWRRRSWTLGASCAILAGLFAISIAAVQLAPASEYWKSAMRWIGSGSEPLTFREKVPFPAHQADSLDPVSIIGVVVPRIYSSMANPYAGFAALVLAVFGALSAWRRSAAMRAVCVSGFAFLILSLGAATWLYGVLYALLPGLDKSRHPAAAVAVWHLCLVVACCYGWDRLPRLDPRWLRRAGALLAAFAVYVYGVFVYLSLANPQRVFGRNEQSMAAFTALVLGAALLLQTGASRRAALRAVVFLVAVIEVSNVAGYSYFHRNQGWTHLDPLYRRDADVAAFLRSEPGRVRVNFDRAEISYNFGDWWGIDQYQGYTGVPETLFRRAFEGEVRELLGETHWISKSNNWNGLQPVFASGGGLFVYRLREGRRVWVPPPDAAPEGCRAVVESRVPEHWRIALEGERCKGRKLVVNQSWAPGWEAIWNDGRRTPVEAELGLLQAFSIEKAGGREVVDLRYRPGSFRLGWLGSLSGLGLLLGLSLWTVARRSRRK